MNDEKRCTNKSFSSKSECYFRVDKANSYSHPNETAKESVLVKKREDRKYAFSGRVKGAKRND